MKPAAPVISQVDWFVFRWVLRVLYLLVMVWSGGWWVTLVGNELPTLQAAVHFASG